MKFMSIYLVIFQLIYYYVKNSINKIQKISQEDALKYIGFRQIFNPTMTNHLVYRGDRKYQQADDRVQGFVVNFSWFIIIFNYFYYYALYFYLLH